uniref:LAGLIDADG endonuclease n=1 Tax=Daedalea confragosa TaxID=2028083 RepID=UPI002A7F1CF1|nr:LAGLIDADG endonuclease [Daedaleopsis confragosa]WNZ34402.1 LAGLIDADG endonuclease [Daedaleopsis confragosa]
MFTELHQLYFLYFKKVDIDEWEKILLYAGNSSISSPLVYLTLGKIYLKQITGQSAGNFSFSSKATAITNNTYNSFISLPKISEHVTKHNSNLTDQEFGHFLAGLIEGDGWFGLNQLHIIFSEREISLAYLIKKRIGYGNIYKIKDKKAVRYICKNKIGLSIIYSLVNGKFVSRFKYEQLLKHHYNKIFNCEILPPSNNISLENYWLAGFTQADGCFHISIAKSKTHKTGFSVRLEFSIKQNDVLPLKLLYNKLNMGNLSQYSSGIWCYKSSGYKTSALLIDYFDTFNLFGGKYIDYLKFRKVYILITEGKHLEEKGILKIKSIATKGSSETSTQEV